MSKKEELYSSHIFMFPFRFDYIEGNNKIYTREFEFYREQHIDKRINVKELLLQLYMNDTWKYEEFNLDKIIEEKQVKYYNEFSYFYDYAKEALYNLNTFSKDDTFFNDEISYYFEHTEYRENKEKNRLILNYEKSNQMMDYNLQIDGISLRIFQTGVAILSLEIENYSYKKLEDIKRINEIGRRFYPQYLNCKDNIISNPDFMACSIEIENYSDSVKEKFNCDDVCIKHTNQIKIGHHIMSLLGESFTQDFNKIKSFYIQPIMDDRMFVLCWYGSNLFASRIQKDEQYTNDNSWYEYVFIDKNKDTTVQNEWMKNELIFNATYDRWSKWKTLFGITRYSFVILTDEGDFGKNVINIHMNTMYFQMIMLLLVTRASILRFSDEVSAIADLNIDNSEERLSSLYAKYLSFYNRVYFKEVTHQDQGIELYDMALKQMKIPEHVDKLDGKFEKLFNFVNMKSSAKESSAMNWLTLLVSAMGVSGLFIAMFSMGVFEYEKSWSSLGWAIGGSLGAGLVALLGMRSWSSHTAGGK